MKSFCFHRWHILAREGKYRRKVCSKCGKIDDTYSAYEADRQKAVNFFREATKKK